MLKPNERGKGRMPLLVDTPTIIERFKNKHGNKYDYSLVEYKGSDCLVDIICKQHGLFQQRADQHAKGNNCPKCAKRYKPSNDEFIDECMKIFNNNFTYEKTQYKNTRTKIIVNCIKHGYFEILPYNHKNSQNGGCPKCSTTTKLTLNDFVSQSNNIHNFTYIYDKVEWLNTRAKVTITCRKHGDFVQIADQHLRGRGCPKCGDKNAREKLSMSVDDFINIANDIHNNKYDYSKVVYKNSYTKVEIICPYHGSFWQRPHGHLQTRGCKKCGDKAKFDFRKSAYIAHCNDVNKGKANLYIIKCWKDNEVFFKVGITIHNLNKRFAYCMPYNFEEIIFAELTAEKAWDLEKYLHNRLKRLRYKPKIQFGGSTECFFDVGDDVWQFVNRVLHEQDS